MSQDGQDIVRAHPERHLSQVVAVRVFGFGGSTLCSGTYIAPRVVLTAAHCLRSDAIPGQTFVYYGKRAVDLSPEPPDVPPPGSRSDWARAETAEAHPDYDPAVNYPDFAVLFLDRKLPFAPIELARQPVTRWTHRGRIAGWGGKQALTPDISQVAGAGVERSAMVRLLGSPTAADFHEDDPNPGLLDPAIRSQLLKTDGQAPHANTCAGDSGGPLLVRQHGRERLAGVNFWTGLSCEDYAMFTRVQPFLDYFDAQAKRGGKAPIVPRLECVEELAGGKLRAHFGYQNDNGVTVKVPYGSHNWMLGDKSRARPSAFAPGDNGFAFSVDFRAGGSLRWELSPPGGPRSVVTANASSPRCDPDDPVLLCSAQCDAELAAACSDGSASRSQCVDECIGNSTVFGYYGCPDAWNSYLRCVADVPADAANWDCSFPGTPPQPLSPNCDAELGGLITCLYY